MLGCVSAQMPKFQHVKINDFLLGGPPAQEPLSPLVLIAPFENGNLLIALLENYY